MEEARATTLKWLRPSLVRISKDSQGWDRYEWMPDGKKEYQAWHADPGRRIPRQRLLEIRGFLNYVVRTYPWINPYLKGLHLTID